jgi:hypothetical protein
MIIPYTVTTGPPELMPVTREAEIPNHELVSAKQIPKSDHLLKFLSRSWV